MKWRQIRKEAKTMVGREKLDGYGPPWRSGKNGVPHMGGWGEGDRRKTHFDLLWYNGSRGGRRKGNLDVERIAT